MSQTTPADAGDRRDQLLREMRPVGLLQIIVVEQLSVAIGRLAQVDADEDAANPAWVRRQAQVERSFYRALAEFRRLAKANARAAKVEAAFVAEETEVPEPAPAPAAPAATRARRPDPSASLRSYRANAARNPAGKHRAGHVPSGHRHCLASAIG